MLGWIAVVFLFVLGLLVYFGMPGFSFSALVLFGIGGVILCYRLLGLLSRKHRKAGKVLGGILTACLCLGVLASAVTGWIIADAALGDFDADCEYVVVLGAGVNGTRPSLILRNRLNAAYDYLIAHPDAVCVVSGGQGPGEDISEAQCMFNDLVGKGIPAERVWMEDKSTSTQENLAFSLDLLESRLGTRPEKIGILSNEFHLYRAGRVAAEQGVEAVGIPAETSWKLLLVNYFLREIAGVWYYAIF